MASYDQELDQAYNFSKNLSDILGALRTDLDTNITRLEKSVAARTIDSYLSSVNKLISELSVKNRKLEDEIRKLEEAL